MRLKPDFLLHGKNVYHVSEQSAERNIWPQVGASVRKFEKNLHTVALYNMYLSLPPSPNIIR